MPVQVQMGIGLGSQCNNLWHWTFTSLYFVVYMLTGARHPALFSPPFYCVVHMFVGARHPAFTFLALRCEHAHRSKTPCHTVILIPKTHPSPPVYLPPLP
eukprot:scaffold112110_cov26-Tisochrysis_lutea.AAC.1